MFSKVLCLCFIESLALEALVAQCAHGTPVLAAVTRFGSAVSEEKPLL